MGSGIMEVYKKVYFVVMTSPDDITKNEVFESKKKRTNLSTIFFQKMMVGTGL
jgi:hypothetical protein